MILVPIVPQLYWQGNTFMSITLSTSNRLYCNCGLIGMQLIWNVVQM